MMYVLNQSRRQRHRCRSPVPVHLLLHKTESGSKALRRWDCHWFHTLAEVSKLQVRAYTYSGMVNTTQLTSHFVFSMKFISKRLARRDWLQYLQFNSVISFHVVYIHRCCSYSYQQQWMVSSAQQCCQQHLRQWVWAHEARVSGQSILHV